MLKFMRTDLIKHFLWMIEPEDIVKKNANGVSTETKDTVDGTKLGNDQEAIGEQNDPSFGSSSEPKHNSPESLDCAKGQEISNLNEDKESVSKKSKASKKKKKNKASTGGHAATPARSFIFWRKNCNCFQRKSESRSIKKLQKSY